MWCGVLVQSSRQEAVRSRPLYTAQHDRQSSAGAERRSTSTSAVTHPRLQRTQTRLRVYVAACFIAAVLAYMLAATVTVTADLVYTYLQHYVRRLLYFVQNQSVFEQNACLPVGHLSKAADLKWNEFH